MSAGLRARAGLLQVCLAGVLWGTGGLVVQLVRDHAPLSALTISGYRTGIAALALALAVLVLRRSGSVLALLRAHPVQTSVVGLCTAAYQALYFASVVAVGVTVATVVSLGLAPLLLAVRDAVRHRAVPGARDLLPVVGALTGLVLVSGTAHAGETGPEPLLGVLAALASGSAYALATALGEPLARTADPLALTTATTVVGACGLVPVALLLGGTSTTGDPTALALLAYLGLLTFALAYGLLYAGLRTTSSSHAVLATLLEPVTAALVAWVVLGEQLTTIGLLGVVCVLAAIASLSAPTGPVSGPVGAPTPAPTPAPPAAGPGRRDLPPAT